jgi:hypothetical protein
MSRDMARPAAIPIRLTARSAAVVEALASDRFVSPELYRLQLQAERAIVITLDTPSGR